MSTGKTTRINKRIFPGHTLVDKDGYKQIRKIGLTRDRVKTDAAFNNSRQRSQEFAQVAKAVKIINRALLTRPIEKSFTKRLRERLMQIIKTAIPDCTNTRHILNGNLASLNGLEYYPAQPFSQACKRAWILCKQPQKATLHLLAGIVSNGITAPGGCTHYRIIAKLVSIDLNNETSSIAQQRTTLLPVKVVQVPGKSLVLHQSPVINSLHLLILAVQWYRKDIRTGKVLPAKMPTPWMIAEAFYPKS